MFILGFTAAGKIQGEEAAKGNLISLEDLVIGATALRPLRRRHAEGAALRAYSPLRAC